MPPAKLPSMWMITDHVSWPTMQAFIRSKVVATSKRKALRCASAATRCLSWCPAGIPERASRTSPDMQRPPGEKGFEGKHTGGHIICRRRTRSAVERCRQQPVSLTFRFYRSRLARVVVAFDIPDSHAGFTTPGSVGARSHLLSPLADLLLSTEQREDSRGPALLGGAFGA